MCVIWHSEQGRIVVIKRLAKIGVEMNIDLFHIKREYYKRAWMNSLKHQMRDVPDFNSVFNDVTEELKKVDR
jgi:hypothetical protein